MKSTFTRSMLIAAGLWFGAVAALQAQVVLGAPTRNAGSQPIAWFYEEGTTFDPAIPSPEKFLGYEIGAHHTPNHLIVAYLKELDRLSDRATYQEIGYSYERQPLAVLTVTSPANHARLEELRQQHLRAIEDPASVPADRPVIVHLAGGVHGAETSGPEAMMLAAYWLVAGTGAEIERALREGVYHVEPMQNPDGRSRHVGWINSNRALQLVADPVDAEHTEPAPGGRTNHYLYDLNRDWLPLENPESRARIDFHHAWKANVVTDHHEMGTNSTFYFEPSKPVGSWNPLIPERMYTEITVDFAKLYRDHLDKIGSFYFTKENYDNTYPGYGSTYPKFLGGYALTFEQASSRGTIQESAHHGVVIFAFTIRNQTRAAIAAVRGAVQYRQKLQQYQRDFFTSALSEADKFPVKAYVWGDTADPSRNRLFLQFLLRHRIDVYEVEHRLEADGKVFEAGKAWVVPTRQPHYRLVRSIFEKTTHFADSTFYDASTWTMALAYGVPHAELRTSSVPRGYLVQEPTPTPTPNVPQSRYGYLLDWRDSFAPRALNYLLARGVRAFAAVQPFTAYTTEGAHSYGRGTISIPVQVQHVDAQRLHALIQEAARDAGVPFQAATTGFNQAGPDLGSNNFRAIEKPSILMVNGGEANTLWHLLDTKAAIPVTKINPANFGRADLNRYNVLVLPATQLSFLSGEILEDVKRWVRGGGTLITLRDAATWAVQNGFTPNVSLERAAGGDNGARAERREYGDAAALRSQRVGGSIWLADLDISHPLGFGYTTRELPVWRDHSVLLPPSRNPFSTVAQLTANPHLSGYATDIIRQRLSNSPSVIADRLGNGSVVLLIDQPNYRGYWYGTQRLFYNALFFGPLITLPATR